MNTDETMHSSESKVIDYNMQKKRVSWIKLNTKSIKVQPSGKPDEVGTPKPTFQESLKTVMVVGQLFSLIPVQGLLSKDITKIRFANKSWRCVYSLLSLMGQTFIVIMTIHKVFNSNTSLKATTSVIFYLTSCISMVVYYLVAKNWPKLVQDVCLIEDMDASYDHELVKKSNITCAVVLSFALFEHILSLMSAFAGARYCYPDADLHEGFVRHFYPWVFDYFPYSMILGLLVQALHFQATFIWNYSDLFVICVSFYLTSKLTQVNKKLLMAQGKYLPEAFWRSIREEYSRVTQVVRKTDEVIGGVVFMTFANNLFFICFQLFNTLENGLKGNMDCPIPANLSGTKPLAGYETAAYFIFSLVYLITRSVSVSLIAAQVNTASTVPAPVLYDVPSPVYCTEVQRFLEQVNSDNVALTGLHFFSVTRGLLLTVAGTIVTYELVMVQFNSPAPTKPTDATTFADVTFTTPG